MGWFYPYDTETKTQLVNYLNKEYKTIDYSLKSNVLYALCPVLKNVIDDFGNELTITVDKVIVVFLLSYDKSDKTWGYKPISEDNYPYCFDCPKRILLQSTIEDSSEWRKDCLAKTGSKIKLIENAWYEFSTPLKGAIKWQYLRLKRNWKKDQMFWRSENGLEYRIVNVQSRFNPTLIGC